MANIPTIVVGTGNQQKVVTPALLTGLDSTGAIVALKVDASGNLLTSGGGATEAIPVALGSISGAVTLNRTSGQQQNGTATGNVTINVSNGVDWDALDFWVIASGANRTLDLNAAIQKPSDSAISFPVTITSGKGCRVKFEKHGSTWMLVSLVKSYTL